MNSTIGYNSLSNHAVTRLREGEIEVSTTVFPPDEAQRLRALREKGDLPQLRARIKSARDVGWTLRSIGAAIGSPHTTVKMWQVAADPDVKVEPPVEPPPRHSRESVIRLRPDIPADEVEELRRLARSARTVRGWTPPGAQSRLDAAELERRLEVYVNERKVPVKRIANHLGLTYRAIAARLERVAERRAGEVKQSA